MSWRRLVLDRSSRWHHVESRLHPLAGPAHQRLRARQRHRLVLCRQQLGQRKFLRELLRCELAPRRDATNKVTVDLNGLYLQGVGGTSQDGITISGIGALNVAVVNGTVRGWGRRRHQSLRRRNQHRQHPRRRHRMRLQHRRRHQGRDELDRQGHRSRPTSRLQRQIRHASSM